MRIIKRGNRLTCTYPGCHRTYSLVRWHHHLPRFYPNARAEIIEGKKHMYRDKGLCALHYDRKTRGTDLNAPILPAPTIEMIMNDGEK